MGLRRKNCLGVQALVQEELTRVRVLMLLVFQINLTSAKSGGEVGEWGRS